MTKKATQAIIESGREAPAGREVAAYDKVSLPVINETQYATLYGGTPDYAIRTRPGRGGRTFRYVTHGYVTDRLNKAFGWNWSFQLLPVFNGNIFKLTETTEKGKTVRNLSVYGELTVRVLNPFAKGQFIDIVKPGPGSQNWEESIEFGDALKGAKSDALKVAAHELGIGLDLYYDDGAELQRYDEEQQRKAAETAEAERLAAEQAAREQDDRYKLARELATPKNGDAPLTPKQIVEAVNAHVKDWGRDDFVTKDTVLEWLSG